MPINALTDIPDLALWLDAADLSTLFQDIAGTVPVTASAEFVGTWRDKSGNGFHLTAAADDGTRAVFLDTGGVRRVEANGTNQYLRRLADLGLYAAGAATVLVYCRSATPGTFTYVVAGGNSADNDTLYVPIRTGDPATGLSVLFRNNAGTVLAEDNTFQAGSFDGSDHVVGIVDTGSEITPWLDGIEGTPFGGYTRSGVLTPDRFSLFALLRGAPLGFWPGRILGVGIFRRALSDTEVEDATDFLVNGDGLAPVLSNPMATATGETTADLAVDTDEGNGTLFWVVTQSATPPSGAQVAAGQDHTGAPAADSGSQAVSGTGTQNIAGGAAGLAAGTTYWAHFVQDDDATNRSNVDSSGSFTTDAVAPPVTPVDLEEGAGGGGRRRGRRYPYPNVIDDGWDWDAPDARAEPEKPQGEPEKPRAAVPKAPRAGGLAAAHAPVQPPKPAVERARPAPAPAAPDKVEPAVIDDSRVAGLEAEVEELRTQMAELKAKRRQDDEEERLLSWFLEDE